MVKPLVILGCTATGKSDLAEALAARTGATLLAVDALQVYRGMDIGTAKPGAASRAACRYEMLDLVAPWEAYSAARFAGAARPIVEDHIARGKPLILIAGTILYLRAVLEGLFEGPSADAGIREALQRRAEVEGSDQLHAELAAIDPAAAQKIHANDLRRITRALEVYQLTGTPISALQTQWNLEHPPIGAVFVGIQREKEALNRRINARVRGMIEMGLEAEVRSLMEAPRGLSEQAASGVGYRQFLDYFAGRCGREEAIEEIKIATRHLAKLQRTWMKRFPRVRWIDLGAEVEAAGSAGAVERVWLDQDSA
jgi:tRNA dimethylallyltransferase